MERRSGSELYPDIVAATELKNFIVVEELYNYSVVEELYSSDLYFNIIV